MAIPAPSISDAPLEIIERILDFLHDDRTTLSSASLVSRKWVHAPRHHLFRQTLIAEIYGRGRLMKDNATSFLTLARSENCTILPAIQSIILMITTPELVDRMVNILALSKNLSKVVYIHLSRSDSISWHAHSLSNVRDIAFEYTWFAFGDDAWRLITSFHHLHTLSLYIDTHATISIPLNISASHFRSLRTLRLRLDPSKELFGWLKSLDGAYIPLETLDLRMFCSCHRGWGSVDVLNSILNGFSETLKHLSLGIDYNVDLENQSLDNGPHIDLSMLVNLRSLFLRTHDLSAVCDSLESLDSSTALEILTVHALDWPFDQFSHYKQCQCLFSRLLTIFASILEGTQFMRTQILDLSIPEGFELDTVVDQLRKWKDRGALRLSYASGFDAQRDSLASIRPLLWPKSTN